MFDMNVGCGNWPFRPTPPADAGSLEALLRAEGVTRACAYPLEAYLWPDPQEANELRLPELARSAFFVPSAVLNPTMPGCLKDYETCRREWDVPIVRLFPGYHLYALDDQSVDALTERMAQDGAILGIHLMAEDERMQNPIAKVPPVPFVDAVASARRHPSLRVIVFGLARLGDVAALLPQGALGALWDGADFAEKVALPDNVWIDLSFFEFESSFITALKLLPVERLLFGTHTPLFYARSNVLKISNSEAPAEAKSSVLERNAKELLGVDP